MKEAKERQGYEGKCPDCGGEVSIECNREFSVAFPYELVCYGCGWFDFKRFQTLAEAQLAKG